PGYECYCKQGTYYDPIKLQCFEQCLFGCNGQKECCGCRNFAKFFLISFEVLFICISTDTDECQDINSCIDGQCINTEGSYSCFCTHPMVLDSTGKQCIRPAESSESDVYQDLCWQHLNEDFVCSQPLVGKQTTYTECCCLYGDAWGMQCALCPMKNSGRTHIHRPITVVLSANFSILTKGSFEMQSLVYSEKRSGESTQPWGAPVLIVQVSGVICLASPAASCLLGSL
uniref:Uncharacterized protein n=1 Tax=Laticauda laticaudata TaxID=8630 RepID=A0A8C5S4C7_LATLA